MTTIEIARALRSLAADAALGRDLTARMIGWRAARGAVSQLDGFYLAIADTARTGLRFSLADSGSYRASGETMLAVLADLESVDADARDFAATSPPRDDARRDRAPPRLRLRRPRPLRRAPSRRCAPDAPSAARSRASAA